MKMGQTFIVKVTVWKALLCLCPRGYKESPDSHLALQELESSIGDNSGVTD